MEAIKDLLIKAMNAYDEAKDYMDSLDEGQEKDRMAIIVAYREGEKFGLLAARNALRREGY